MTKTSHIAFLYFQLSIIFIISYKLLLLIIIITIIMIMVITNNCIVLLLLYYYHCFHQINFYFDVHTFIFHLISFIIFIWIHSHHGNFLFKLIGRRANKLSDQVQRSHSIPLAFKFYVLILIYFRVTFMGKFFFWIYLFGFGFFNILIFLLFG